MLSLCVFQAPVMYSPETLSVRMMPLDLLLPHICQDPLWTLVKFCCSQLLWQKGLMRYLNNSVLLLTFCQDKLKATFEITVLLFCCFSYFIFPFNIFCFLYQIWMSYLCFQTFLCCPVPCKSVFFFSLSKEFCQINSKLFCQTHTAVFRHVRVGPQAGSR